MSSRPQKRPAAAEPGPAPRRFADHRTPRRRLWADRLARRAVSAGGMAIIASILGILVFILIEIAPLLMGARVSVGPRVAVSAGDPLALVCDEHVTHAAVVGGDGRIHVYRLADGAEVLVDEFLEAPDTASEGGRPASVTGAHNPPGTQILVAASSDGVVHAAEMQWSVSFDGDERRVTPGIARRIAYPLAPDGTTLRAYTARIDSDGAATVVGQLASGTLVTARRDVEENMFTGEVTETWTRGESEVPPPLALLTMDSARRNLFGAGSHGELLWWHLDGADAGDPQIVSNDRSPITALGLLIGDQSLVVGREDGSLSIWFPVRQPDDSFRLAKIRSFPDGPGPVRLISPSMRNRGFLAETEGGRLGLYYSTSDRVLWSGRPPIAAPAALYFAPKADGALLAGPGELASLAIDNPHPEVSLKALFGRIWYEGYNEPEYVWQSTGASDAFESKLSLTPLMIGTLKGTIYSLFLAIPLGILGAMYTSQFMHPSLKRYVKPVVEIMAALPSVVLGFLAGLWLAPRVETILPALFLMMLVIPVLVVGAGLAWQSLPLAFRHRFHAGSETIIYAVVIAGGMALCLWLNPAVETWVFGGSATDWLLRNTGLPYDQRNAVVVGLAMGFAVIPIIFSIAEDAFSNVPRNLVSGSLALGASRWQTVTRVVLPSASPGIFSAIMIGFGRAVGETMIVLMATGNTPIMDWNPFNGFRTLSANIAVEIPEAPQGGTLYRTLFLAALILFAFTFVINTAAELIRQRLRRRYAQL